MRRGIHLFVDVKDTAIESDEERPPRRKRLVFVDHAVGGGNGLGRVAQQRVINAQRLGESLVGLRIVDTDRKMRDVESPDLLATLTE